MKLSMKECMQIIEENDGYLDLTGRADITELPDGLIVSKDCILRGTSIKQTPNNFIIGGNLFCEDSAVQKLGKNTIIRMSLYCNAAVENLPDDLIVGNSLWLHKSNIKEFPNGLRVGYSIFKNPYFEENLDLFEKEKAKIYWLQSGEYIQDKGIQILERFTGEFIPTTKRIVPLWDGMYYQGRIKGVNVLFDGEEYHIAPSLQEAMYMCIF